jgi:hypothetical protein
VALLTSLRSALAAVAAVACAAPAAAQLSQEQALAHAFPGAPVERRTAYLTPADLARAAALAGPDVPVESGVVTYYVGIGPEGPLGVAYFDGHRVRTLREVLMIVVTPAGRVRRVETVAFREPPEYQAPEPWLRQFDERELEPGLSLKGRIAGLTGATLTAHAVTRAVRRVLALHQVITPLATAAR